MQTWLSVQDGGSRAAAPTWGPSEPRALHTAHGQSTREGGKAEQASPSCGAHPESTAHSLILPRPDGQFVAQICKGVHVCVHVSVCECVCVHLCACVSVNACARVCMCLCVHVCAHTCVHVSLCESVCTHVYVFRLCPPARRPSGPAGSHLEPPPLPAWLRPPRMGEGKLGVLGCIPVVPSTQWKAEPNPASWPWGSCQQPWTQDWGALYARGSILCSRLLGPRPCPPCCVLSVLEDSFPRSTTQHTGGVTPVPSHHTDIVHGSHRD